MSLPTATVDRPLALRLRPDLIATPVAVAGSRTWIVKDPLTLEHFQFTEEEHFLLDALRRPVSIARLERAFARRFPPQTITPPAIWHFLGRLHSAGLLVGDAPGQGHELLAAARSERLRRWVYSWTQLLAIRFRGVDPDRFLTAAHARVRWLFTPAALVLALAVITYAASLVVGNFAEFRHRLPELAALADVRNILWLMLAIGIVKVLHELGHALACKHWGGEVHELGLMLLAFTPCLYCDVTDAWRLPSKWRRIAVSAAGMGVELVLAAVATIVWWYAHPGMVQLVALNVIVVCTVSTLLVNGNPLLRYDGYYILSDLVEVPNLWQRSRDVLRQMTGDWFARQPLADDPLTPTRHRAWLAGYALASKLYLALVCIAIVWGLVVLLYPYRLHNLAYVVGLAVVGSALVRPVSGAVRLAGNPARRADLRAGRIAWAAALGLAMTIGVLALPVNYYVRAPLVLLPVDAARVYATVDGSLIDALPAGQPVVRGQTIATLDSPDAQLELVRLAGDFELQQLRLAHLERLRGLMPEANEQLPTARAALADVSRRLDDRRRDAERLALTAPADGVVIPVPRAEPVRASANRLPQWSGAILDAANRDAHVAAGTLVCLVGNPAAHSAVLLVSDTDVKRLRPGQAVRLRLDQLPGQVLRGEVIDVARHDARDAESSPEARTDLSLLFAGLITPGRATSFYQVQVRFDAPPQPLAIGGRGQAKVAAERITLARWLARFVSHTFRLPM